MDDTAEIQHIVWKYGVPREDKEFMFVIGSGILNFIDRRGIRLVYSKDKENKLVLEMLGFEYDVKLDRFSLDLTDYFKHSCK